MSFNIGTQVPGYYEDGLGSNIGVGISKSGGTSFRSPAWFGVPINSPTALFELAWFSKEEFYASFTERKLCH